MRNRMLGRVLVLLGVAATVLSLAWWAIYYNEVIRALGQNPPLTHPLRCLLWTSDVCTQAKATANLTFPAYHPLAMWLSFVVLVLGLVVIFRSASTGPYPLTPAGEPRLFVAKPEPFYAWTRDLAWPLVRIAVGGTLLVHGMGKVLNQDVMAFAARSMAGRGLRTVGAVCLPSSCSACSRDLPQPRSRSSFFSSRSWRTSATAMAGPIRAVDRSFR